MIAEAFAFVQFPILPLVKQSADEKVQMFRRNPKLCTPSDFDYSPYFKIIKYPFVDIHYHDDHHLLPWSGGAQLDEEETHFYMDAASEPKPEDVEEAICHAVAVSEDKRQEDEHSDKPESPEDASDSAKPCTDEQKLDNNNAEKPKTH